MSSTFKIWSCCVWCIEFGTDSFEAMVAGCSEAAEVDTSFIVINYLRKVTTAKGIVKL